MKIIAAAILRKFIIQIDDAVSVENINLKSVPLDNEHLLYRLSRTFCTTHRMLVSAIRNVESMIQVDITKNTSKNDSEVKEKNKKKQKDRDKRFGNSQLTMHIDE
ncbi:hypothetical protein M0804_011939 [Polistes exclamans]|nr:hypothetical protein M0804_011939 [Polistes exclamans]